MKLAQIGFNRESQKESLKALMVLSRALLYNVKELKIPSNQTEEAIL